MFMESKKNSIHPHLPLARIKWTRSVVVEV